MFYKLLSPLLFILSTALVSTAQLTIPFHYYDSLGQIHKGTVELELIAWQDSTAQNHTGQYLSKSKKRIFLNFLNSNKADFRVRVSKLNLFTKEHASTGALSIDEQTLNLKGKGLLLPTVLPRLLTGGQICEFIFQIDPQTIGKQNKLKGSVEFNFGIWIKETLLPVNEENRIQVKYALWAPQQHTFFADTTAVEEQELMPAGEDEKFQPPNDSVTVKQHPGDTIQRVTDEAKAPVDKSLPELPQSPTQSKMELPVPDDRDRSAIAEATDDGAEEVVPEPEVHRKALPSPVWVKKVATTPNPAELSRPEPTNPAGAGSRIWIMIGGLLLGMGLLIIRELKK